MAGIKIIGSRGRAAVITGIWIGLTSTIAVADPLWHDGRRHAEQLFRPVTIHSTVDSDADGGSIVAEPLRRQVVVYPGAERPGTIVIDTANTHLYYVLGGGKALRYGIGVGREGFTWSGVRTVDRLSEWPDWIPPAEMIQRQPYLPRLVAGGPQNPLGARAIYLSGTLYRIHGTNAPSTIGQRVSSGCIRMLNQDVIDLYGRVHIGTKVVVLPSNLPPAPDATVRIQAPVVHRLSSWSRKVQPFGLY